MSTKLAALIKMIEDYIANPHARLPKPKRKYKKRVKKEQAE